MSHCEVQTGLVHTRSDGAFVDPASNGRVCVAVNGAGGPGAVARAVCTRDGKTTDPCNSEGPELPKFISLHLPVLSTNFFVCQESMVRFPPIKE